jgi:hypothetical protein
MGKIQTLIFSLTSALAKLSAAVERIECFEY